MLSEREVYFNGEFRPWDQATVHIMSHSFGRGSEIFEVIGFHETPAGPAVFRLDEYIARFRKSAELLEMEMPLSQEAFQAAVLQLVKRSGLKSGFLKMHGFYPDISFNVLPPQKRIQVAVCVFSAEEMFGARKDIARIGVSAFISHWRRLDPQTIPIEAKVAGNYINGMVARLESRAKGFDYAVLLDTQGFIAEGGTEALFLVQAGRLMAPALGTVLKSITRKTVLEVAGAMGIETFVGPPEAGTARSGRGALLLRYGDQSDPGPPDRGPDHAPDSRAGYAETRRKDGGDYLRPRSAIPALALSGLIRGISVLEERGPSPPCGRQVPAPSNAEAVMDHCKGKIAKLLVDYFGNDFRRITHALEVLRHAERIMEEAPACDREVVIAVALLHDVGIKRSEELLGYNNGKTQETYGPPVAEELLKSIDFPSEKIIRVSEIIGNHHSPSRYDYVELRILKEADRIVNRQEGASEA